MTSTELKSSSLNLINIDQQNSNFIDTKISITFIGIDNYKQVNNIISFFIYFKPLFDIFLENITITINIFNTNRIRVLENTNKKIICKIQDDHKYNLLKYNCLFDSEENITRIEINENIDFGEDISLIIPNPMKNSMNNVQNQIEDKFSSKTVVVLKNSLLKQNNNNFFIVGVLDGQSFYSDNIILNIDEKKNIRCITKDESINNYEIECFPESPIIVNLNNTIGETNEKIILIVMNEKSNDLLEISKIDNNKDKNNKLSKGIIIGIILGSIFVVSSIFTILFMILRKKKRVKVAKESQNYHEKYTSSDNIVSMGASKNVIASKNDSL